MPRLPPLISKKSGIDICAVLWYHIRKNQRKEFIMNTVKVYFLSGKGGYDDTGHRKVVAIKCLGKPTLYVDPSGSSYCRYMGVENEKL